MILEGRRTGMFHNFTVDVNPGYIKKEKFRGGIRCYMMESRDLISNISYKLKNGNSVSFDNQ